MLEQLYRRIQNDNEIKENAYDWENEDEWEIV